MYFIARNRFLIAMILFFLSLDSFGQENNVDTANYTPVKYGEKGFEFRTRDNKFLLQIQSRLQFRFATPEDQDPVTFDDFNGKRTASFSINRARV